MKHRLFISCCLCALAIAPITQAKPIGAFWEEVPIIDNPDDPTNLTGFRSFDLFIQLEPGDTILSLDSRAPLDSTDDLYTDGLILGDGQNYFQHNLGSDTAMDPVIVPLIPDVIYDSRFQMGLAEHDEYLAYFSPDWVPTGMLASIGVANIGGDLRPAHPDSSGAFWYGRFTVNSLGNFGDNTSGLNEFLGGQILISGNGPNGVFGGAGIGGTGILDGVVDIPNAFIPTPGAAIILGGFLLLPGRRHRASQP